jgi:hypothetical protein
MIVSEKPPLLEERFFSGRWPSYKRVNSEPGLDPNSLRSILFQFSKSPIRLSGSIEAGLDLETDRHAIPELYSFPPSMLPLKRIGDFEN